MVILIMDKFIKWPLLVPERNEASMTKHAQYGIGQINDCITKAGLIENENLLLLSGMAWMSK